MAWARIHVQARKELYEPTLHGHDSAGGGPVLADLSDERVTQAVFTKDKMFGATSGAGSRTGLWSCRRPPRSGTEGSGQVLRGSSTRRRTVRRVSPVAGS